MNPDIKNIVVFGDTHFGCTLALCPPEGAERDGQSRYLPSPAQLVLWAWWLEFWEWVATVTRGEPYALVHIGDVIDGDHHNSTTQITHNLLEQERMAVSVLQSQVEKAAIYYSIRGTEAHVGKNGVQEESIAQKLGACERNGRYARMELWLQFGAHLIHCLHHVGTTSSSAHESSAVNAELTGMLVEAAISGKQPPSVMVRGHRHRAIKVSKPTQRGDAIAVVTPAWQLKTPFAFKVAGARISQPQIGGINIRLDDSGNPYVMNFTKHIVRDEPE